MQNTMVVGAGNYRFGEKDFSFRCIFSYYTGKCYTILSFKYSCKKYTDKLHSLIIGYSYNISLDWYG